MQIGSNYSTLGLGGTSNAATGTGLTGLIRAAGGSLFGPSAQVSINGLGPAVTGFTDYTKVGNATGYSFNLAGVMGATTGGFTQPTLAPERREYEQALVQQALDAADAEQYDVARDLMNNLLQESPTNAAAAHALGYTEQAAGNYDKAEQYYLKAHALNSRVGYDNDANNVRILQGSDDEVYRRATAMLKSPAQHDEGIRILMALSERNPEHVDAHVALGEALLDQGDGENGLMQYSAAIRVAGDEDLDMLEERVNGLRKEAPDAPFVQHLHAKVMLRKERYEEALQSLTRAADLSDLPTTYDRDTALAHVGIGRARLDRGDLIGALSSMKTAKQFSSTNIEVKEGLAEVYLERADQHRQRRIYDDALNDYYQVATLLTEGTDPNLRDRASQSVYSLGLKLARDREAAGEDIDSEVVAFQAAYDLDSDNTKYKQKLAETRAALGDQYLAAENYESAAAAYQRAYDLYSYNKTYKQLTVDAYILHGDDRLANANYDDAIAAYRSAWKIDTSNTAAKTKLAEAYTAAGEYARTWDEYEDAVTYFKEALHLFPDNSTYQSNYDSVKGWDPEFTGE